MMVLVLCRMHYLADLFLNQKQFPSTAEEKQALRTFR